jgi:polar amino acid transport system substrate-binding protein
MRAHCGSGLATLAVLVTLAGCGWPRDAGNTLDDVRGGVLRVGVTESAPWTEVADDDTVRGVEVTLVERLAERLDATVEWYPGAESELMAALKHRVLDMVIGGLTDSAPWVKEASLTRPYVTIRTLVAARAGVPVPEDLAGTRVVARAGTEDIALLMARDAVPVAVPEPAQADGLPAVLDEWEVGPAGLAASRHTLAEHKHVLAVPLGENGFQTTVERFLLGLTRAEVLDLLEDAAR